MQEKLFLEILQNSQENTCPRDSFLINNSPGLQVLVSENVKVNNIVKSLVLSVSQWTFSAKGKRLWMSLIFSC